MQKYQQLQTCRMTSSTELLEEAVAIVPGVKEKIKNFDGVVLFTRDTHETYYLDTQEVKETSCTALYP